jgi:hypothetical protein
MPGHLVRFPGRSANGAHYSERLGRLFEVLVRLDIVVREAELIDDDLASEDTGEQQRQVDERIGRIELLLKTRFRMPPEEVDIEAMEVEIQNVLDDLSEKARAVE